MNNMKDIITDKLNAIFEATDETLNEWKGTGNLQFPSLISMMAVKMNWSEKEMREAEPIVRFYVRNHTDWYVTRGAHGGIMKYSEKQKKEAVKLEKEALKAQMKAAIEAKEATKLASAQTVVVNSTPSSDDSE